MSGAGFTPRVIDGDRPTDRPPSAAQPVSASSFDVPMMGRIAAGVPIEAISTMTQSVAVPGGMISGSGEHYALEVQGDSMIDAGINDGDVVIIRETSVADDGDIVVAFGRGSRGDAQEIPPPRQFGRIGSGDPAY